MRARRALLLPASVALCALACGKTEPAMVQRPTDATYGLGHTPSPATLAALDIDVDPTGRGLPPGAGNVAAGAVVYAARCASCHGAQGEGIAPNPALVGRTPDVGYDFSNGDRAPRTIGNYWPYATTVFDYVRRAMPLNAPGTLSSDDTYAVVAWLLHRNAIIAADATMNATTLPAVDMPARNIFVPDDRPGGATFR